MKKAVLFLSIFSVFISCQKDVQLVQATQTIDSLVVDHSPVYIFYNEKGNDTIADVNRKNTISTTNWIYNIDKRLPLKKLIPAVIALQNKRRDKGVHTNDEAKDYFSYMDSTKKTLAFIPFTDVNYAYNSYFSSFYVKENIPYHSHFQTFYVNFKSNHKITVDGNEVEGNELLDFLKDYTAFSSEGKQVLLYLNFDENLTFQDYLSNVIALQKLVTPTFTISPTHFIYDEKKLPDCNCVL